MPLAFRYNVAGERLSHVEDDPGLTIAPGPVAMRVSRARLSTDVRAATLIDPHIIRHSNQFDSVALAPQRAPEAVEESFFAAEFTGNGRVARNPLTSWSWWPGGSPEGRGWQEDRFGTVKPSHREFYPGIEPSDSNQTFLHVNQDQRRNMPYDRAQSFGEQILSHDEEGAYYQDLSATGGY